MEKAGDCQFRTYQLALACTGEYATFHGGNVPDVMAAMVTTMARVNGVTEMDASVHMEMVPNNDTLIFLNAGSDPYDNGNGSNMLGQNQTTCDARIGSANYDIGHVFSTGGGGVAYLGCVCNNSIKAGGVTGQGSPVGDPFDIDYVAHEMGHQYGANHTQNNSCNRNNATAMEPGSASTIMGYAGICSPNVQNNSDAYYHAISLQEIGNFVTGSGNSCSSRTTFNDAPDASSVSNYNIPKSTHFVLTGIATDPDPDTLTYCWEQMDNATATMPPVSTNTGGPAFRSLEATESPDRYFPNLPDLLNNVTPTWEVLPSVSRTLNFRLTVRDNHFGGGCTDEIDMDVIVDGNSGPFLVTAPNTNVSWPALSTQTVTWDVAGTTAAPVNAANVDIFLSIDGGNTYPITLATGTPNDGTHDISVPNNQTSQARVMVRGSNNIFFDISNVNFTISAPLNGFTLAVSPDTQSVCAPANAVFDIDIGVTGSFTGDVDLSVTGVPAGASASFSVNPVAARGQFPTDHQRHIRCNSRRSYDLTITASNSGTDHTKIVKLIVSDASPAAVVLSAPADGVTGVALSPTLSWSAVAQAATYDLQLATDAGFTALVLDETGISSTNFSAAGLNTNTQYFWRARGVNACGNGPYSSVFDFTTVNIVCTTFASTDVPVTIPSSGTPTVTSNLTISDFGEIDDLDLTNLDVSHSWINDLIITLESPGGTEVTILSRICERENNILINFDDESSNAYGSFPCPPTNNETYQPFQALSGFDTEEINGDWTLTIEDVFNQDGGTLNEWSLDICYAPSNLNVAISKTDITCFGAADGTATASATGGNGSYSYEWNSGPTTQTINGLGVGTYTVTVTSGAQTGTDSVFISEPTELTATFDQTNVSCNGGNDGSATVNPTGGNSPYNFEWLSGEMQTANDLTAGTYTVTVTDSSGCTIAPTVTITEPDVLEVSFSITDITCFGGMDGSVTANPSGGTAPFTYVWSNGGNTQTISGVPAGSYTVTITDDNECTDTLTAIVAQPTELLTNVTPTHVTCFGNNEGEATATPSGGTPPYSYEWSTGDFTATITGLAAGIYTVTVTDDEGCTDTISTEVIELALLGVVGSVTDVNCNGGSDGTATVTPSGGVSPYVYSWTTGDTTQNLTGLSIGTYGVTVTDDNGCTGTVSLKIEEPDRLEISENSTEVTCYGGSDGSATAFPTGGISPYLYNWSNGDTTQRVIEIPAGTYDVTVTDDNGCTETISVVVNGPAVFSIGGSGTEVNCNGGDDGTALATPSGGIAPYSYFWSTGDTLQNIVSMVAGVYGVTVTDDIGCTSEGSIEISEPDLLTASGNGTDVNCNGGNDGTAMASPLGGTSPYTYNWSNGGNTQNLTGLTAGTYGVTVTDDKGCTATDSIEISEPDLLTASGNGTDVNCNGGNDGTAMASPLGGTSPYTYNWSNGGNTQNLTGLTAGTYGVTVTDDKGCTATDSIEISQPDLLTATGNGTDVNCNGGNDGTAMASTLGGTSPYSYNWSNGGNTQNLTGLTAGTYGVTVTDDKGCTATDSIEISQPDLLTATGNGTDVNCNGGNNGTATASPLGGTSPYSYNWSNGGNTQNLTGLSAGAYGVTVTDDKNCTATASIEVEEPVQLTASVTGTNVACNGGNNGTATATPSGGTSPFTYNWSNNGNTQNITGLSSGIFDVTITDDNGCTATGSVEIDEQAELVISAAGNDINCNGGNDGTAMATPSGGTSPYSYNWSNGDTTQNLSSLSIGTYFVTVADDNGCMGTASIEISQPDLLSATGNGTDVNCNGGNDGTAMASPLGGTSPYSYNWSNGGNTQNLTALTAGTYGVTVTDDNGCTATDSIQISQPDLLTATGNGTDVNCNGGNDGTAMASPLGGTSPYSYNWSNGGNTQNLNALTAGTYGVTVTDDMGCTATASIEVSEPDLLTATGNGTDVNCNGGNDGTAMASPLGGTSPYSYNWSNGGNTQNLTGLTAGTYGVTVTDDKGCTATDSIEIFQPDLLTVSINGSDPTNVKNGSATADVTGGTMPYSFNWSNGDLTPTADSLGAGTYDVTVTDDNGCSATGTTTLNCPDDMVIDATLPIDPVFHADNSVSTTGAVTIENGEITEFKAGSFIDLSAEFEVESGAVFTALIEGCNLPVTQEEEEE